MSFLATELRPHHSLMVEVIEKLLGSSTMISVFVGMARVQDARTAMATAHLIEDDIISFNLRGAWMMRVRFRAGSWESRYREGAPQPGRFGQFSHFFRPGIRGKRLPEKEGVLQRRLPTPFKNSFPILRSWLIVDFGMMSAEVTETPVVVEMAHGDAVCTIRLNRPSSLNSLSKRLVADLAEAFRRVSANKNVKAVILTVCENPNRKPQYRRLHRLDSPLHLSCYSMYHMLR